MCDSKPFRRSMASKKPVVRCNVCGIKATKYVGNGVMPVCDNVVCYHTTLDEMNKQIVEAVNNEGENQCHAL